MSELKTIVDGFMHDHERSQAWVAQKMGISRSALNGWWTRGRSSAPSSELLRSLARVTKTPYRKVLDAALLDFGYLPEEGMEHGKRSAEKIPEVDAVPLDLGDIVKRPRSRSTGS